MKILIDECLPDELKESVAASSIALTARTMRMPRLWTY